ncbi:reduced coenzyme F420:NADP oxidoreductase [Geodermatophilus tzadiensis]|uniref:Reduced coenzyme F420:NADP oxidoreductase n=1 Tax=Geodermatophilus tzadiensis TaxID=1137988 RepID=A0A2T0TP23_9ACTN|nr:NADPH-dependent F420 reductase [Geodermatophilus tzadiensis]PRY47460.1 reduced coenzyme F420:NADP oxidoreductase [Geodermatophilus tzadiensis]
MSSGGTGRPVEDLVVGVLGGTGPQGRGLAVRLASVGQRVLLGSRDADRAREVAASVAGRATAAGGAEASVQGGANPDVAGAADLVVVAVPFDGHAATLAGLAGPLAGKVVVDCVVPMGFDDLGAHVVDVPEGSVAQQAAALLPDSAVVGAFHHVSAVLLEDLSRPTLDGDVLVVGDDRAATDTVQALAGRLPGMRGVYAGRLRNARQVEALTVNLVSVNRRYRAHAGIRVTDV